LTNAIELTEPITIKFKSTIETGRLLQCWKYANITPLFKKGDERSIHGPIGLTCIVSKIQVKIVRDCLTDHLRVNKLLSAKLSSLDS